MSVSEYWKVLYALHKVDIWIYGVLAIISTFFMAMSIVMQDCFFYMFLMYDLLIEQLIYNMHYGRDNSNKSVERLNDILPMNKVLVVQSYLNMRRYIYLFMYILMVVLGLADIINTTVISSAHLLTSILLSIQTIAYTYKGKNTDSTLKKFVSLAYIIFLLFCTHDSIDEYLYDLLGEGKALYGVVIIIVMTISLVICENKRRSIINSLKH
ncbi:MAG: hypothetical protein J6A58_05310 [Oscillospiraceae bacterium]|nr:hypothetical protein [Oscillospiraceae bacterium]